MEVYYDLNHLPRFRNAVVTIGSFDGVHCGHQKIIEKVNHLAQSVGGESVVITFHPHPRQIIYPRDTSLRLITTTEEKVRLFERYGVDHLVVVPFSIAFSQQSADEYIQKFLIGKFHPKYVVIGYDHRFGLNRQGDINYLRWHSREGGFEIVEIEKQEVDDIAVSSTKIRKAMEAGDLPSAQQLLGHPFPLTGKVVHGQKIGTSLGFPTANLAISERLKLIPPHGIYAVKVWHQGQVYGGMLYIGTRPSIRGHDNLSIEVNIFDFEETIYGDELFLELIAFIRKDAQFEQLEQLRAQLEQDRESARRLLAAEAGTATKKKIRSGPSVAVVILNYNGRHHLEQFLPSVLASTYESLQVYVADNGSTDDSLEWLADHCPSVTILPLEKNYGFAQGYNQALQQIDSDYYLLLNSDVQVTSGWIEPLLRKLEKDKKVAAVQPKILSFQDQTHFEYAGAAGGWMDALGYPFCRGRIFGYTEVDEGQYDKEAEIFWASGAALFIRAKLFHRIGGFDPDYFAHAEEIDLCWRLKKAGFKIMAAPESVVFHVGGGTLEYQSPRKTYLNFRNTLFTILKNETSAKLWWLIPLRFLLDGLAGGLFLAQGKFPHIWSILRAHASFYRQLSKLLKKRAYYQALIRKVSNGMPPNLKGRYPGSVVWQYYALGRRRFQDFIWSKS